MLRLRNHNELVSFRKRSWGGHVVKWVCCLVCETVNEPLSKTMDCGSYNYMAHYESHDLMDQNRQSVHCALYVIYTDDKIMNIIVGKCWLGKPKFAGLFFSIIPFIDSLIYKTYVKYAKFALLSLIPHTTVTVKPVQCALSNRTYSVIALYHMNLYINRNVTQKWKCMR